jgi:cell division protein FtsI/penicillin-binding protein 2
LSPISREAARRRRLMTRALPLVIVAAVAFVVGVLIGGRHDTSAAERFADAWQEQDFGAMHDELTADAAKRYPLADFEKKYQKAETTITSQTVVTGEVRAGETEGGNDAAIVPVSFSTNAFGHLGGDLVLPLADGAIDWSPNLVYPGLKPDEHLTRRTRTPKRAAILAADGTPLAEGPAYARSSPLGTAASAIAGEVGTPKGKLATSLEARGFPKGSLTGLSGLELAFDSRLAGHPGGQLLAGGGHGGPRIIATTEPKAGEDVKTTIDPDLQRAAVTALGGTYGGVAVLDAQSGSVLALSGIAFSAPQPPGSTFKIITTTAALDAGMVHLSDTFPIATSATVDGREVANANNEACGGTFVQAFAESCNSVFVPLGPKIGSDRLVDTAERYGFNSQPSLYDVDATAATDPPAPTIPKSIPTDLDLGVSAIGQGEVQATPLEMASVAQTIANGGVREPTNIVKEPSLQSDAKAVRVTSKQTAATIRGLMIRVVTEGTGTAAALPDVQVAGKTGTAELGPKPLEPGQEAKPGETAPQEVDAWFTSFAPASDPKIVVAVMVVNANGAGGEIAAPIAREVLAAGV